MRKTFLRVLKFLQIKEGGPNFWGNQFCRKSELFGPLFCISILKVLWTQIDHLLLNFNALCMIQEYFYQSLEICTNQRGGRDLISEGNQFCRKFELFGPPFCISILKVLWTEFLRHLIDINSFCMIQE